MPMGRALVLMSPAAGPGGKGSRRQRIQIALEGALVKRGLTPEFPATGSAEETAALLRAAPAEGYELAVVAGGDGTVRLAVGALATTGLPLAIVPLGTGNLLAATLGIPRNPLDAAANLATATPTTIDSGMLTAGDVREAFAVAVGAGFDARVMSSTGRAMKSRFGVMAYFATVLRMLPLLPVVEAEIVVDGRTFEMPTVAVLVANCGQIIPGLLGPRAALDPTDGLLDVIAIRGGKFPTASAACSRVGARFAVPIRAWLRRSVAASARLAHRRHDRAGRADPGRRRHARIDNWKLHRDRASRIADGAGLGSRRNTLRRRA